MAMNSAIFKVELQVADIDRQYYHTHSLTLARHPSETDERMMARLLVFALHANDKLSFGKGLSTENEPDLWQKDLVDDIELWIDIGRPDEKHIRRACGRAKQVYIYAYDGELAEHWWHQHQRQLNKLDKLFVYVIPAAAIAAMVDLTQRTMQLQCTIQDGEILLTDGQAMVPVRLHALKPAD